MNQFKKWLRKEDFLLKEIYNYYTLNDLCYYFPNRTRNAIAARISYLNLKYDKHNIPNPNNIDKFASLSCIGCPHYCASDKGNIYSRLGYKGRYLNFWTKLKLTTGKPYVYVSLYNEGKHISYSVHKLVLNAFVGPKPEKMQASHKNDNPEDNRLKNLEWATHEDNMQNKKNNKGGAFGEKHPRAKMSNKKAKQIFLYKLKNPNKSHAEIGNIFNVSPSAVCNIVNKKNWTGVTKSKKCKICQKYMFLDETHIYCAFCKNCTTDTKNKLCMDCLSIKSKFSKFIESGEARKFIKQKMEYYK